MRYGRLSTRALLFGQCSVTADFDCEAIMRHWDRYTWEAVIAYTGSFFFILTLIVVRWV